METAHHTAGSAPTGDEHGDGLHADWDSEEYVTRWLQRQEERAPQRRRQFVTIRALIPKRREDEFSYVNLGAGPGNLDEVLLEHFSDANATLVDGSLLMLDAAQKRLARFGNRVEYVQADLANAEWAGAVGGPFDFVLSTLAIHHLGEPARIRDLYAEIYRLLGHGGMFLNLEYVRPARPSLAALTPWAARDPEAGISGRSGRDVMPGTLAEQLGWLSEAGFPCADVLWKELGMALLCGLRDHLHMPDETHAHAAGGTHAGAQ